jgi:hypothetical protein
MVFQFGALQASAFDRFGLGISVLFCSVLITLAARVAAACTRASGAPSHLDVRF